MTFHSWELAPLLLADAFQNQLTHAEAVGPLLILKYEPGATACIDRATICIGLAEFLWLYF